MKKLCLLILCVALLLPLAIFAQAKNAADDVLGIWYNAEKTSKVEIFKTTSGKYAGRIIWLKEPLNSKGEPKLDAENPEAALQSRPLMNLNILQGLSHAGKAKYDGGTIYDPKSGKTYSCKAELVGMDTLKLRGFIGVSLVGRTSEWTRTTK